jgi:hypothetical protein
MIWKILLLGLFGYGLLLLLVFGLQRKMLYLPSNFRLSEQAAAREGLRYWPSLENYRGFSGAEEAAQAQGTVIVFHGNAGAAYHRSFYVDALTRQGLRVILAEYPGYGGRAGHPSEAVLVEDARETIRLVYRAYGEPLYLWGESLGAGVVSGAISQTDTPIKGAVLFLPWDSLPNLAQTIYWYFPARWLVLDTYNSVEKLRHFDGKVAVILAEADEVIPLRHGQALYDSITTTKKLWLFEQARHNEMPVGPDLAWWQEVVDFITR